MNSFFGVEGPLISALDKCGRVILLSVMWLICCIPLFTVGASCSAFYYSITKTVMKERSSSAKEFIRAFKRSFKRTLRFTLILIPAYLLLALDIYVWAGKGTVTGMVSLNVCILLIAVLTAFSGFLFPVISRFIFSFGETVRFTLFLVFRHLPVSAGILVLLLIMCVVVYIMPIFVLFMPGVVCVVISLMIENVFKKYIPKPEEGKEVWYDE